MVPMDNARLDYVCGALSYLQEQNIAISELLAAVLVHNKFNRPEHIFLEDLSRSVPSILSSLYHHPITTSSTQTWAHSFMCGRYVRAAQNLSHVNNGWHFAAARATPAQVRDFRLEDLAKSMRSMEPELWTLIFRVLGGTDVLLAEDASWHASSQDQDAEDAEYWVDDEDFEKISDAPAKDSGAKRGRKQRERAALIRIVRWCIIHDVFPRSYLWPRNPSS